MEFHDHILQQMAERGVTEEDVRTALALGWPCGNARPGAACRTWVFEFGQQRGRRSYAEKEVTVYYKPARPDDILLTVIVRYGQGFPRGGTP